MTPEYYEKINQNRLLHQRGKQHVGRTRRYRAQLQYIVTQTASKTLLDWGCGKGQQWKKPIESETGQPLLQEYLGLEKITCYDPAVEEYSTFPSEEVHDLVICTDVLSLIPEADIPWVFQQLRLRCGRALYLVIESDLIQSKKVYPDKTLKQVTVKSRDWWIQTCQRSANWHGITTYWKWCEDGRIPGELPIAITFDPSGQMIK